VGDEVDRETAYHEAGHAVLAHITGVYLLDGPIGLSADQNAETPLRREHDLCVARAIDHGGMKSIDHNREEAIICAGGSEAQRIYLTNSAIAFDEEHLFRGAHGDVQRARELLGEGCWVEVCASARRYLQQPNIWRVVEALAEKIATSERMFSSDAVTNFLEIKCVEFGIGTAQILK
jgi:hypothetical protein